MCHVAHTGKRRVLTPVQQAAMLDLYRTASASQDAVRAALAGADAGRVAYWDALLLVTAAEAGCTAILSEDLADGTVLHGVRIINPFAAQNGTAVEALLSPA